MSIAVHRRLSAVALLALGMSAFAVAGDRAIVPVQVLGERVAQAVEFLSKNYDASAGVFHNACLSTEERYYFVFVSGADTAYLFTVADDGQFVENVGELAVRGGEFRIGETMGGEASRAEAQEKARWLAGVPFILSFSFEDIFKQPVTQSCMEAPSP